MVKRDLYTVDNSGSIPDMPTKTINRNGPKGASHSSGLSHYLNISELYYDQNDSFLYYDQNCNCIYLDTYSIDWLF